MSAAPIVWRFVRFREFPHRCPGDERCAICRWVFRLEPTVSEATS